MKKILSIILTAAMLLSAVVMTAGAEEIGFGEYAPNAPTITASAEIIPIDENQVDAQGIYYTLNDEDMTAVVGKNTYADSASAAVDLKIDSIIIPYAVKLGDAQYTITAVGRNAFDGTAIREVVITCETIGEFAFAGCTELEYVYSAATDIKGFAFWGCTALTEVYCFTAQTIGGGAFWNCSNLKTMLTLSASVIMEKAFEGCNLSGIVFISDAPEVASGALGTTYIAYYLDGAAGFEDFPISTAVLDKPILDVEEVYAKAGETVQVSVMIPAGATGGDIEIALDMEEGLSVTNVISGSAALCMMENAAYDAGKVTGTVLYDFAFPGTLVILEVKVADDAAAGNYFIAANNENYTSCVGGITICDHAETKTITVKAASCDEAGTENTVCMACGEVISSAEVEAKGHTYKDFVIAPTCTEAGYTRHICECCADAYTDAETEALGHTWNEGEVVVPVSTTKEGLIKYTCNTCGAIEQVIIPKIKYGDANNDGDVNLFDVTVTLQYIAKWDMTGKNFNEVNADVNVDGSVILSDVTKLLQYIAGWDVVLGPQK